MRNGRGGRMKCPKCGGNHATQLMVWMDGRDILKCEKCRQQYMFPAEVQQTVFDQITASPEELAEKLVYSTHIKRKKPLYDWKRRQIANKWFLCVVWKSSVTDETYSTKAEAIAATLAKLKEVKNEQ
jgi:predicted nucleic-acid-binding Zn-ribbon protein